MGYLAKTDTLFFEILDKAVEKNDMIAAAMIHFAVQAFHAKPRMEMRRKIQAYKKIQALASVSTDFDKLVSDAFNVTVEAEAFDLGYERVFRSVPLGTKQDHWDIYDVANGLQFRRIPEGDRIRVEGLSGTVATAHVDYYGGALGWTDAMIRYRKIAAMVDMALTFRNRFYSSKANNHYLLLAAAAVGNVTAYQGVVGDGQLRRDIQTLNRAAYDLANRCKDKGYGDTAAIQFVVYANPLDKARILSAMSATTQMQAAVAAAAVIVQWNISPMFTFNSNIVAGSPIMVLPGNKIQMAEDLPPTTFTAPKDVLTLNEVQSVWSIYGAAIGDTDQLQTLTLA